MLKKSLLSLAVSASLVGLTGCNISSTTDNSGAISESQQSNDAAVLAEAEERLNVVSPIFAPLASQFPLGIDFIFAAQASATIPDATKDGTAHTGAAGSVDESAITNAIDDLAGGISTLSPIDIAMSGSIDPTTVVAGASVILVKLPNATDIASSNLILPTGVSAADIDALDLASLGNFFSQLKQDNTPPASAAETVVFRNLFGSTFDGVNPGTITDGMLVMQPQPGVDYSVTVITQNLGAGEVENNTIRINPLKPLDGKTKYIAVLTNGITSVDDDATADVDEAQPIRGSVDYEYVAGSTDLFTTALDGVRASVQGWESMAGAIITQGGSAALASGDAIAFTSGFTTADPSVVLRAMASPSLVVGAAEALMTDQVATVKPAARTFELIQNAGGAGINQIPASAFDPGSALGITSKVLVSQGAIELPQYTVGIASDAQDQWEANTVIGDTLESVQSSAAGTTPPFDLDQTKNVTYRYPFAQKQRDVVVPVMMFEPVVDAKAAVLGAANSAPASVFESGCTKPADGWPVIIMQHGFQSNRTANLINGTNLAEQTCSAVVAMDLPHHGVPATSSSLGLGIDHVIGDGSTSPFAAAKAAAVAAAQAAVDDESNLNALDETILDSLAERHEQLWLNSGTGQVEPMVYNDDYTQGVGDSGSLWIRLDNFQRTRDNMRQGVMDLLNLNASIGEIDLDGTGALGEASAATDLDVDEVTYVGHSLGGIVGTVFVAVNNDTNVQAGNANLPAIQKAVLATPGGHLTKLIENSVGLSGAVLAGLAASNDTLVQGNANLESYMKVLQATIDSADPMNFIADLAAGGSSETDVLTLGMYGNALASLPSDVVVPISGEGVNIGGDTLKLADFTTDQAESANNPLTGFKPMVELLGADNVADGATKDQLFAKYNKGGHGTFSSAGTGAAGSPDFDNEDAYDEMLNQSVDFLGEGAVLPSAVDPSADVTVADATVLDSGNP